MKKILASFLAVVTFITCGLFSTTAYAATNIATAVVAFDKETYTYTGSEITPQVTLTDSFTGVVIDPSNYSVSYENNIGAGTAKVIVNGLNEYEGTLEQSFEVAPKNVSSGLSFTCKVSKLYSGKKLSYTVKYNGMTLTEGVDYTVVTSNNTTAGGTATATITGMGNYTGTKKLTKTVYPNKVTGLKSTDRTTTSYVIKWNSLSKEKVTGYKVYKCDEKGNNLKLYKTVSSNSCKVTGLKAGAYGYFKVRAYKKVGEKTYYGDYSSVYKTVAKPATVKISSVSKSTKGQKIVVKWDNVGATGYEIQYTTDKNFKKSVKTVTVEGGKSTSKTISVKSSKTYYARVRAFRRFKYNGSTKKVYGSWSSKLSTSYSKLYATYTTNYVSNKNRTTNLKIACKAINGTIVYPGKTFSFNKVVGKRTRAKGYKDAYIFTGSNSHTMGTGGGVCQVASTMFNTTLIANLKIAERHQHSQRVTYVPLGRDAAIYWGSYDFKFTNNTNYPIKIKMKCSNGKLTCAYYTCMNVSPKKVKLKVSRSGKNFTLRRYVGGKVNYTTKSHY